MFGSSLNRLGRGLKRALSGYAVGSQEPTFVSDFVNNKYISNNTTQPFSDTITHSIAGNATMTDGYGPELVTNGGFDADSDWTKGTGWSIADGKARHASGANSNVTQTIETEAGRAYVLEFRLISNTANFLWFAVDGAYTAPDNYDSGIKQFVFVASASSTSVGVRAGSSNECVVDNVSVREMPVIKWAPHNLLTYSEDLSQWTEDNVTLEADGETVTVTSVSNPRILPASVSVTVQSPAV